MVVWLYGFMVVKTSLKPETSNILKRFSQPFEKFTLPYQGILWL